MHGKGNGGETVCIASRIGAERLRDEVPEDEGPAPGFGARRVGTEGEGGLVMRAQLGSYARETLVTRCNPCAVRQAVSDASEAREEALRGEGRARVWLLIPDPQESVPGPPAGHWPTGWDGHCWCIWMLRTTVTALPSGP